MVRVVAHESRHVERRRQSRLPVLEQVAEARVRLLGRPEPRELPHRPELAAVHRRVDASRERIDAGEAEVALVVDLDVVRRVERLVLEPRDRREELALPLGLRVVELALPLRRAVRAGARIFGRGHFKRILRGGFTRTSSCRRDSVPIPVPVERLVAVVICAAVAAPSASPLRDASRLSGFRVRHAVPTSAVSATRYRAMVSHATNGELTPALQRFGPPTTLEPSRAWYDVRTHRLFVQRSPRPGRRELIHECVRALIDQNFGLERMVRLRTRDHDRWYAAQGMVDGVAALSSGLPAPGRALASQLRYLGGRGAVTDALRMFPQTTEQLLHVDKFLERERALPVRLPARGGGAALVASETFGELDVRDLLQAFHVPGAAVAAAG